MRFLLDGDQVIEERSGSDALLRQYIWGQYVDELVQQREYEKAPVGQPYADWYPITDLLHRTVALTDDKVCQGISSRPLHAKFVEVYDTDIYGRTKIYKDAGPSGYWFDDDDTPTFDPRCRYLFTGREYDPETGLYYYRARYYHPDLGRFISRDPLLYDGGDMNLYGYAAGNPAIHTDPSGEFIPLIAWVIVAAVGVVTHAIGTNIKQQHLAEEIRLQNPGFGKTPSHSRGFVAGDWTSTVGLTLAMFGAAGAAGPAFSSVFGLAGESLGASVVSGAMTWGAEGLVWGGVQGAVQGYEEGKSASGIARSALEAAETGAAWGAALGGIAGAAKYGVKMLTQSSLWRGGRGVNPRNHPPGHHTMIPHGGSGPIGTRRNFIRWGWGRFVPRAIRDNSLNLIGPDARYFGLFRRFETVNDYRLWHHMVDPSYFWGSARGVAKYGMIGRLYHGSPQWLQEYFWALVAADTAIGGKAAYDHWSR